jgi:hypothetical protein
MLETTRDRMEKLEQMQRLGPIELWTLAQARR